MRQHHLRKLVYLCMACLLLAMLGSGCAASKVEKAGMKSARLYYEGNFDGARQVILKYANKTDENFVLNNLRLGSACLADYRIAESQAAFLRAYEVLNSYGVNNGGRSLGAVVVQEKIKVWKGEPFERAMANFYLGLTFYMQHDYANARGAFENALFKLREYSDEKKEKKSDDAYRQFESNFTLAYLMLGRCWMKLDRPDLAQANFARAAELQPALAPLADLAMNQKANVLLVVDYGTGPQYETNFDGAIVGFVPKPQQVGPVPAPQVIVDGQPVLVAGTEAPPVDLLVLAQDRRWQSIDTIRTVKSAVGTGLIAVGAYEATKKKPEYGTAAALVAAGLLLKATSQADVRHWETLPRSTFVIPLELSPGNHDITVRFFDGLSTTWQGLVAPAPGGEATYYFRPIHSAPSIYRWGGPAQASEASRISDPAPWLNQKSSVPPLSTQPMPVDVQPITTVAFSIVATSGGGLMRSSPRGPE